MRGLAATSTSWHERHQRPCPPTSRERHRRRCPSPSFRRPAERPCPPTSFRHRRPLPLTRPLRVHPLPPGERKGAFFGAAASRSIAVAIKPIRCKPRHLGKGFFSPRGEGPAGDEGVGRHVDVLAREAPASMPTDVFPPPPSPSPSPGRFASTLSPRGRGMAPSSALPRRVPSPSQSSRSDANPDISERASSPPRGEGPAGDEGVGRHVDVLAREAPASMPTDVFPPPPSPSPSPGRFASTLSPRGRGMAPSSALPRRVPSPSQSSRSDANPDISERASSPPRGEGPAGDEGVGRHVDVLAREVPTPLPITIFPPPPNPSPSPGRFASTLSPGGRGMAPLSAPSSRTSLSMQSRVRCRSSTPAFNSGAAAAGHSPPTSSACKASRNFEAFAAPPSTRYRQSRSRLPTSSVLNRSSPGSGLSSPGTTTSAPPVACALASSASTP